MFRILAGMAVVGVAAISANAAQFQIGGSSGLTSAYVGTGSAGNAERNYDLRLYAGAVVTPTLDASVPYTEFGGQAASTLTDSADYSSVGGPNKVQFAMISDGCAGTAPNCASNNFWDGINPNGTGTNFTVQVGKFGVTDVWTMLNDVWGTPSTPNAPVSQTSVTFNFGTTANATTFADVVTVALLNAYSPASSTAFGQIRAGLDCSTAGTSSCMNYASGPLAASANLATTVNGVGGSTTTVVTGNVSNKQYTNATANSQFGGSSGRAVLDDQGFLFGSAYSNLYLVSIIVSNTSGAATVSQTAISAITVDTATAAAGVATPEPISMGLALSGLGALLVVRRRRAAQR